mgnify:CR=1
MVDRATEIAVLFLMSGTERDMRTFSHFLPSLNNSRLISYLHIYVISSYEEFNGKPEKVSKIGGFDT